MTLLQLTITSRCGILSYAVADHATEGLSNADDFVAKNLKHRAYMAPSRGRDGDTGFLQEGVQLGDLLCNWRDK